MIEVDGFAAPVSLATNGVFTDSAAIEHDVLAVSDSRQDGQVDNLVELGGELRFEFDEALVPALGDDVEFLFAGQLSGRFDRVTGLPELGPGLSWAMVRHPTSLAVEVVIAGDYNADGVTDVADYTAWRDGLGWLYTTADYHAWRDNFGATAPESPAGVNAPEPAALALITLGCLIGVRPRGLRLTRPSV